MAIQIYCEQCRTSNKLDDKKCRKCGVAFGREKTYRVDVSLKGRRITRQAPNLTLAREVEANLKTELLREEFDITAHKTKKAVTLADVWDKYLPWAKEHKKTWDDDEYHYNKHLEPRFGSKVLEDISPLDIERMKSDLKKGIELKELPKHRKPREKPYTPATIKHMLVLLNRLYNVARKWNLYEGKNPVLQVERPKLDNQVTEFLSDEDLTKLLNVLDNWPCRESAAFVKFALYTGLRRGELFKLQWQDIDFDRRMVTLRDPKGGKTETIPLSEQALKAIEGLRQDNEQEINDTEDLGLGSEQALKVKEDSDLKYVFPGKDGKQRVEFKLPWLRIRKAAGLPADFRFHGLRHNFASHLVSNGVDLYTVGKLLTHKNTSTTQRYAHLSDQAVMQAAQKSGELLTPKHGKVLKIVK
ncbi:MAG TPA: tyrosine-type recombinase/integrase [Syntrophobacteraceae bacterium]|nr:tyrosine-type recombinase/integrase [Syntrophobacteraceae bacterium]